MSEQELLTIVENANMIVSGYAFTLSEDGNIRVFVR